jgi:orotidine-5'-phosphate decarboxylase
MLSDSIIEKTEHINNPLVIGLDTKFDYLPMNIQKRYIDEYGQTLEAASAAIFEFNRTLIDSFCDIAAVVKIQIAYYEMYGSFGIKAFAETCSYAQKKGLIVIADCKRNDIGSTAAAYSAAYIGFTKVGNADLRAFEADCVTVNPYLGSDGLAPFIDDCNKNDKGIFILVKTSNPSSGEFQDKVFKDSENTLYKDVALSISRYALRTGIRGYSNIGAVTGATYPEAVKELREIMKTSILLVPGYGAQGADVRNIKHFFNKDGTGALINSSRAILLAYREKGTDDYAMASRAKIIEMRDELNLYK